MDDRSSGNRTPPPKSRELLWTVDRTFQGWTCSQCEWNDPVPTLLNDPEAKTAYDRLAVGKFNDHACTDHPKRFISADSHGFTPRIRKLITQGFKPKDAVELLLQEVALEYRNQPKVMDQARAECDDFLRRVREGLI